MEAAAEETEPAPQEVPSPRLAARAPWSMPLRFAAGAPLPAQQNCEIETALDWTWRATPRLAIILAQPQQELGSVLVQQLLAEAVLRPPAFGATVAQQRPVASGATVVQGPRRVGARTAQQLPPVPPERLVKTEALEPAWPRKDSAAAAAESRVISVTEATLVMLGPGRRLQETAALEESEPLSEVSEAAGKQASVEPFEEPETEASHLHQHSIATAAPTCKLV